MEVDLSEFSATLDNYIPLTRKTAAQALNKKALDLCYMATREIPKTTPAKVRRELQKDPHLIAALTSLRLKKEGAGILKSPQFAAEMKAKLNDRMAGVNYLRSGWAPAVEGLGGTFKGNASQRGLDGYAKLAKPGKLETVIVHVTDQPNSHKQESAEKVVSEALQRAADFQVLDMGFDIARKLSEVYE